MSDEMAGVVFFAVLAAIAAAGFFLPSWLAYTGRYRSWAIVRPPLTFLGRYWSLLPMVLIGVAVLGVGLYGAAALGAGGSRHVPTWMTASLIIGGVVLAVAAIWASHHLPVSLRPAWFRDWQSRGSAEQEMVTWLQERKEARRRERGRHVHD